MTSIHNIVKDLISGTLKWRRYAENIGGATLPVRDKNFIILYSIISGSIAEKNSVSFVIAKLRKNI